MAFTAQELNQKIEFQRYETTQNEDGDIVTEWVTYASAFAKVEPLVGREYFSAMAVQAEDSIKVTTRYREGITSADRMVLDGEAWNIQSVQNIKFRNRELLLYCKRI